MSQNDSPADDFSELRSRAEQSLQKNQLTNVSVSASPEEMLRLIHELAVHQIELEIQQQELKESREELRKSPEQYTDLYDFAPLGYLTLAPDGEIVELNLTAAKILDVSRSRLRGKRLKNFIVPSDRMTFAALMERVFSHKEPNYCEVKLSASEKDTLRQKTVRIEALINENETNCRAMLSDISMHKKMAQAMLVTNERQRLIIDATHSGSWEWDLMTNRTIWSDELWRLIGLEPLSCEASYEIWKQSMWDEDKDQIEQIVLNAVERGHEFTVEWRVRSISGKQRWVMSKGTPFKDADGLVNRYVGIIIDITELKMAQKIGQKEQHFSKTIINSIPGTFYIVNSEGYYTGWNNFQRDEIVGKPENEMRHVLAISTIHPEDRELVQEKIISVLKYGLEEDVEGRVLLHGGPEFRWFLMTGRQIIMDGKPFLIGIGIDITERKKIEAIQIFLSSSSYIQQKEPFFNALARHIAEWLNMDFVCIDSLDSDGLTARALAAWSYGHFEDNVFYTLKDTPCGDVIEKDVCCFPTSVCQLFPRDQVLQDLHAESYVGVTLKNHAGQPIGLIAVIGCRPLVKHQFAETALKIVAIRAASELEQLQNELALQLSEKKYRDLFESVPIGLYQSTMEGKIIAANQHCLKIARCSNLKEQEAWFAQDTRQSYVRLEDSGRVRDLLLKQGYVNNFEADFLLMDGTIATLSNTAKIVFNAEGEPDFIAGSFIDVTERKRNEEEKAKLEDQLHQSQKMEMVGRLAGGIAHDFNNMLTLILGHIEMALEQFDPSRTVYADLQAIHEAATRSADLTRQLLAFARKQIIIPEVLELNRLIENMLPMLRRLIGENIKLVWIPCGKSTLLKIDPSQIDQIIVNLCVNARDAISGNGIITIETGQLFASNTGNPENPGVDYVVLSVSDDGCGIDKNHLDHIFEPFFTTKAPGKGTGLGLSTVFGIVNQNNGSIECRSEQAKGTTFTIHLPLYQAASQAGQDGDGKQLLIHKGHETILLVEDEPAILKLCQLMLERNGYVVLAAATAAEAIKKSENYRGTIDLLVTDVIMPEMNGSELSKKLLSVRPNLKTLFMSGYTADIIANNNLLEIGVNFLQKPVTTKSLTQAVYNTLNFRN